MFVGEEGRILLPRFAGPQFLPRSLSTKLEKPKLQALDHHQRWLDAIVGKGEPGAPFSYAGPMTGTLLLGTVGNRFPGKRLEWDGGRFRRQLQCLSEVKGGAALLICPRWVT